jgi:hypothetical protein
LITAQAPTRGTDDLLFFCFLRHGKHPLTAIVTVGADVMTPMLTVGPVNESCARRIVRREGVLRLFCTAIAFSSMIGPDVSRGRFVCGPNFVLFNPSREQTAIFLPLVSRHERHRDDQFILNELLGREFIVNQVQRFKPFRQVLR